MNFNLLFNYLQTSPLIWIVLTISSFKVGTIIYEKSNKNILLQPILIALILVLLALNFSSISYENYFKNVEIIHFFLNCAVVGLALPLYKNLKYIKILLSPLFITLILGNIISIFITTYILYFFNADSNITYPLYIKSITAPIAIMISNEINSITPLTVSFVIITGIVGALLASTIFSFFKIKSDISKGFSLGFVSHVIGITKAIEISERAISFSILAMVLNGILSAIFLPIILSFIK